jgi:hypothetical protein
MALDTLTIGTSYILDGRGERCGVILPLDAYERLLTADRPAHATVDTTQLHAKESGEIGRPKLESIAVHFYAKGAYASGIFFPSSHGLTVLKGSSISEWVASAMRDSYYLLRKKLIEDGTIGRDGDGVLRFAKNYPFTSSSAGAAVIEGGSRSGPEAWKNNNGKTLRSLGFSR